MKCYLHQSVDAVGICSECGQGICDSCAVKIRGRMYCKQDADKVFGRKKRSAEEKPERGMANTVNAVMFVAYGIFGMLLGVAMLISGFMLGGLSSIPSLGSMGMASLGAFGLGGLLTVMGALGIVAGAWVWGSNAHGIWLGSPLLGIGIVVALFIALIGRNIVSLEIGATFLGINVIMIALAGIGWDTIKGAEDVEIENSLP